MTEPNDEDLEHEDHDDGEPARQLTLDEMNERDPGPDAEEA